VARISVEEVKAWVEPTKLPIAALDTDLATQVEELVLSRIASAYDVSTWVNAATTPKLVRSAISMLYVSVYYDRQYSEDERSNAWARRLSNMVDSMINGIVTGAIDLLDVVGNAPNSAASFFPNDASSAIVDSYLQDLDPSLGPAAFSMGRRF
jgi:hypothetical protein